MLVKLVQGSDIADLAFSKEIMESDK